MPRPTPITKQAIIDAALELGDAQGVEAISMRRVAASLGIQAMSLYNHIANKEELLGALHERLILEIHLPGDCGSWQEALRQAARGYRDVAVAHPSLFVLLATRPLGTDREFTHVAPTLSCLDQEGLSAEQQLFIVDVFFNSLNGYLLADVAPVPGHPDVANPALDTPQGEVPPLIKLVASMATTKQGEEYLRNTFDEFVEVLIAGLEAHLRRRPPASVNNRPAGRLHAPPRRR